MIKDNQKNNSDTSIVNVLVREPKYYQLLISNKWVSFRKELSDDLDKFFIPKVGYSGWKQRFLYPLRNIPKKDRGMISKIMGEALSRKLEKQMDFLRTKILENKRKIATLTKENEHLETIFSESIQAIKTFRNEN